MNAISFVVRQRWHLFGIYLFRFLLVFHVFVSYFLGHFSIVVRVIEK